MEKLIINGGRKLKGTISIRGAKNAAMPIMIGSLLAKGKSALTNVPDVEDVRTVIRLIQKLGVNVSFEKDMLTIDHINSLDFNIPDDEARKIRYSLLMIGVLLSTEGKVRLRIPGGCEIGIRKFDMHLSGFEAMGAKFKLENCYIAGSASRLHGAHIKLYHPTFTGTINLIIGATLADGETTIENASVNPEVVDFIIFLNLMGANIHGAGTPVLRIKGVKKLKAVNYSVLPDRIVGATFMLAAANTQGEIFIENFTLDNLKVETDVFKKIGIEIRETEEGVFVRNDKKLKSLNVVGDEYPKFHTDIQPLFTSVMCLAQGSCMIKDVIYDNRFAFLPALRKMGADIELEEGDYLCVNKKPGKYAIVKGVEKLKGTEVEALDLRGGAAVVLAGLVAEGTTEINNVYEIDRGYECIEKDLKNLGADIVKKKA